MSHYRIILMGELNVRVGSNNPKFMDVTGKFGENLETNGNGKILLDFCQSSNLIITNTFFKHKNIHMYSFGQNRKPLLKHAIVQENMGKIVMDTRVYRRFCLNSDHHLLASKLQIWKRKTANDCQIDTRRVKDR